MTIALKRCFSAFCKILTFDWVDVVNQSTAQYVTIKCKRGNHDRGFTQFHLKFCVEFKVLLS